MWHYSAFINYTPWNKPLYNNLARITTVCKNQSPLWYLCKEYKNHWAILYSNFLGRYKCLFTSVWKQHLLILLKRHGICIPRNTLGNTWQASTVIEVNPICITICIENSWYSSYVLQWNTTQKQPMKMLLHIFYNLAQTKTVIHKWLANFLLSLFHIYPALLC